MREGGWGENDDAVVVIIVGEKVLLVCNGEVYKPGVASCFHLLSFRSPIPSNQSINHNNPQLHQSQHLQPPHPPQQPHKPHLQQQSKCLSSSAPQPALSVLPSHAQLTPPPSTQLLSSTSPPSMRPRMPPQRSTVPSPMASSLALTRVVCLPLSLPHLLSSSCLMRRPVTDSIKSRTCRQGQVSRQL